MASTTGDVISNYKPYMVAYNETLENLRKREIRISKNICDLINHGYFSAAKKKNH